MLENTRKVSDIPGFEQYDQYFVTTKGEVYSTKGKKIRKITPGYLTTKGSYLIVKLCDGNGKKRNFYVHRLVAQLFLLNTDKAWGVEHINGNIYDNSLSNLRWVGKKLPEDKKREGHLESRVYIGKELNDHIKLVYQASLRKGLNVPAEVEFFQSMINEALEEYINRYGLRKIMYTLQNS